MTEAEFAALAKRAGLHIAPGKQAFLYEAALAIESLAELVRKPRVLGSEPATIFTFDAKTAE